jgi:hypothetical protein
MNIVELEKVDVLTASTCSYCEQPKNNGSTHGDGICNVSSPEQDETY